MNASLSILISIANPGIPSLAGPSSIYEMYYQRRAAAAREFGKVETAIKKAAREANVDMRDVKHIFKRIK